MQHDRHTDPALSRDPAGARQATRQRDLLRQVHATWPDLDEDRARWLARRLAGNAYGVVVLELSRAPGRPWIGERSGVRWDSVKSGERRGLVTAVHRGAQQITRRLHRAASDKE